MGGLAASFDNKFAKEKTNPEFVCEFLNTTHKIVDVTAENVFVSLNISFDLKNNIIYIENIQHRDQVPIAFHAVATYYDLYMPHHIEDGYVENYVVKNKDGKPQFTKPQIVISQNISTPKNEFLLDEQMIPKNICEEAKRTQFRKFNQGTDYIITKHNEFTLEELLDKFSDYCMHKASILISLASNPMHVHVKSNKELLSTYDTSALEKKMKEIGHVFLDERSLRPITTNKNIQLSTEEAMVDYINNCLKEFQKQFVRKDGSASIKAFDRYMIKEDKYADIVTQFRKIASILGSDFTSRIDISAIQKKLQPYADIRPWEINDALIRYGYDDLCIDFEKKETLSNQMEAIMSTRINWRDEILNAYNSLKKKEGTYPQIIRQVNKVLEELSILYKEQEDDVLCRTIQDLRMEETKKKSTFDQIINLLEGFAFSDLFHPDISKYMVEKAAPQYRQCLIKTLDMGGEYGPYTYKTTRRHHRNAIRQYMGDIGKYNTFLREDAISLFKEKSIFIAPLFIKQFKRKQFDHFLRKTKDLNLIGLSEDNIAMFFDYKKSNLGKIISNELKEADVKFQEELLTGEFEEGYEEWHEDDMKEATIATENYVQYIPEKIRREFGINSSEYYKQLHKTDLYDLLLLIKK